MLGAAAFGTPAQATSTATNVACSLGAGSVTAAGAQTSSQVTAGAPPTKSTGQSVAGVYQPGNVRVTSSYTTEPNISGADIAGWVIQGGSLYRHTYWVTGGGDIDPSVPNSFKRVGGGWTSFIALETSAYEGQNRLRATAYGLRNDGTMFRWNNSAPSWRATGSAAGFSSIKSMALISKTYTYDTFLANTRGGALYTIRIPAASPMKPIVTKVRSSGWQSFEKLIASKCGQYGTLLLGIDKDTKSGFLYAVGHANGASTVINPLGKTTGTYPDPTNFRWGPANYLDNLNGD
ncbi:hypothetical protein GCM10009789_38890 [Kribbella sancticallisti]|uniref:Uncharacterized protein n=1 Tax=Kribbella sancticallisti TaxID=460087 RepID=A0ABN2DP28_9ACTN